MKLFVSEVCFWFQFGTLLEAWRSGRQADEWDPDWAENDFCSISSIQVISGENVSDSYVCQCYKYLSNACFYSD